MVTAAILRQDRIHSGTNFGWVSSFLDPAYRAVCLGHIALVRL
jgi:hypothetical protein